MAEASVIEGVYLSTDLDLEELYREAFAAHPKVRLRHPHEIDDPEAVRFALCWRPADEAFDPYPNLGLASSIAAGVDSIVNCPSLPKKVVVTRVRDGNQGDLMAGYAAWHVVWHHRNMARYINHQRSATWARYDISGLLPPRDCVVGVLGFGLMGQAIARAVVAMGFTVVAAIRGEPPTKSSAGVSFESGPDAVRRTAAKAHMLINVLPLTPETRDILDAKLFATMPAGAVLIQLGRGEHLVEDDLILALDNGLLSGASIDVFRTEPLPGNHPFWRDPRIVVTPHQASACSTTIVAEQVAQAALDVVAGRRPQTAVDRCSGY